jgi:hypothetical protein
METGRSCVLNQCKAKFTPPLQEFLYFSEALLLQGGSPGSLDDNEIGWVAAKNYLDHRNWLGLGSDNHNRTQLKQSSSVAKSRTFWCCKPSVGVLEDIQF